ncbi:MAG: hypothetical protein ACWGQW_06195 [bacterium]
MIGVLGFSPKEVYDTMTLRTLHAYYLARVYHEWDMTSGLMSLVQNLIAVVNGITSGKPGNMLSPADFNPYRKGKGGTEANKIRINSENFDSLKILLPAMVRRH